MTTDNPANDSKVEYIGPKSGRPKHSWDTLYVNWRTANFPPKGQWLRGLGINPSNGATVRGTRGWDARRCNDLGLDPIARSTGGRRAPKKVYLEPTSPIPDATPPGRATPVSEVKPLAIPSDWETIRSWRRKQAGDDYRTADTVRSICKMILKNSIERVTTESGGQDLRTTLKPHEVRAITDALNGVQRMQRLALGMSTENVGVDSPVTPQDSHVEKNKDETPDIPTFVVEMSSKGKFLLPRPRRVS